MLIERLRRRAGFALGQMVVRRCPGIGAIALRRAFPRLYLKEAMKTQEIATPGCAEHLKFRSGFYRTQARPSLFTSSYRKLFADRYNLIILGDARVLGPVICCVVFTQKTKIGIDLPSEQVNRAKAWYPLPWGAA